MAPQGQYLQKTTGKASCSTGREFLTSRLVAVPSLTGIKTRAELKFRTKTKGGHSLNVETMIQFYRPNPFGPPKDCDTHSLRGPQRSESFRPE